MTNGKCISEALAEIQEAYDREIKMWYRIRRKALKRGLIDLAEKILEEIRTSQWDVNDLRFTNWKYKKYLFQIR